MQHFFKTTELTNQYAVAPKTVRNWIQATRNGSLDLQLVAIEGKDFIANTDKNRVKIKEMVEANRKYRNTNAHKTVEPVDDFYDLYDFKQIRSIVASIENHREIPLQFTYLSKGAKYWDDYTNQLDSADSPNLHNSTVQLIDANLANIDGLIKGYEKVNVVDIGVGNGLPVKNLLAHLLKCGVLGKYIGIDISPDMLAITQRNVEEWFDGKVNFVPYPCDISRESFEDAFLEEPLQEEESSMNIVLVLGGTLSNLRVPDDGLRAINNSMWAKDVLIYTTKLDTPNSRQFFDFNPTDEVRPLGPRHKILPDLLGIDESAYTVEQNFDEQKKERTIRIRLQIALTIKVKLGRSTHLIHLNKGDTLLIWRAWHFSSLDAIKKFDTNGFRMLQANLTENFEYLLMVSRIKNDAE